MAGFDLNSLLNGKSKEVQPDTKEAGPEEGQEKDFEVVMLDIEDLMPSKDNFYSTEKIDELAFGIELVGRIEQNLVVKPEVHGKYEVIAGHRRRLAALKLVAEGKEEYRKVPCRIETESDAIRDKLSLILTNATARQLSDWEKVQQAKELKEIIIEYKKALDAKIKEAIKTGDYCRGCKYYSVDGCECEKMSEEDKITHLEAKGVNCLCYERVKMGRIREIVAEYLNTSTTQIGRMEAIENNLSQEFKAELEKGNINISTAHELSRLDEEGQKEVYGHYEEKGELHIKDVKQEEKEEITDKQAGQAQKAIKQAIKGEANRAVFKVKDNVSAVEKALRKHFEKSFKGEEVTDEDGKAFIYRFQAEGITLIDKSDWSNYLITYADLSEIVIMMIEVGDLSYDDTLEATQEEEKGGADGKEDAGETFSGMNETQAAGKSGKEEETQLPGKRDMSDYPEYVPDPKEKGLPFQDWIKTKYGMAQYTLISKEVRAVIRGQLEENKGKEICPAEWENRITNALSVWVMEKTKEYQTYLQS